MPTNLLRLAAILFTLFFGPIAADAASIATPDPEDAFAFVRALIDSYGYANEGIKRFESQDPKSAAVLQDPAEIMYRFKLADMDYAHAAQTVDPFLKSKDEAIQVSAMGAYQVYNGQIDLNKKGVAMLKNLLDRPEAMRPGSLLESIAEVRAYRVELWRLLFIAVAPAAAHALVALPIQPDEKLSRLRVTRQQRRELMQALEREFGPKVKEGVKAGRGYLEGAGASLYGFLADSRWKSLDSK